jgi:hypothetical protein
MLAHEFGVVQVQRARMSLLLGDTDLGKIVDQNLGLDLQLTGQFINSDLVDV